MPPQSGLGAPLVREVEQVPLNELLNRDLVPTACHNSASLERERRHIGTLDLTLSLAESGGTPGRIRTCGLWVRNPTLYPLSYRRVSLILHPKGNDPPWRAVRGGKGGIRTLGAHFLRSTA